MAGHEGHTILEQALEDPLETKTHKTKCSTNTGHEFSALMDEADKEWEGPWSTQGHEADQRQS